MLFLEVLSSLFGWVYTICWSLSFYSQPLLNIRRKSTSGTTIDFPFINTFGFLGYFISNSFFFWSPLIRSQYALRNHGLAPTVTLNDVVFAGHGFVLCIVVTSQYLFARAWGFEQPLRRKPSRAIAGIIAGSVVAVLVSVFLTLGDGGAGSDPRTSWQWIDVFYTISYVKLVVTVVKYAPQLAYNFRNRSTEGWAISMVLLDFAGGVLSIAQQSIDSWLLRDWSGITGNPAKFALGNISLVYDVLFLWQHYVLYYDADGSRAAKVLDEEDALLPGRAGEQRQRQD